MSTLSVESMDVFYGDVQAVWNVSFEVKAGEIVTLVGANGAGKTTTLRTLAGLLRPRAGRILFEGKDVGRLPANELVRRGVVLIPEARQLWPTMNVLENLELGAYAKGARAERRKTLEVVLQMFPALQNRLTQNAGTLSGGEQQMCAIGRGLMAPMLVRQVFAALKDINGRGVTVLLVEQNVQNALRLARRAYVLETGRVTLEGPSSALLDDPRVRQKFLGEAAL